MTAFHLAIDKSSVWALIAAAVCFGLAALMGLAANLPLFYEEADLAILRARTESANWDFPDAIEAARYDAELNMDIIDGARKANGWKAWIVVAGLAFEVLAVTSLAIAVGIELSSLT